ncbi:GNAT family N-acetyltransferase [Paenibacillus sp. KR2-11]|uniref:GNAT family N-acetyltransferase n=1 Tax=Paenibacillus sp. KR2-11 TaxID=3385500 RepID=UPI0022B9322F|nr:GNAT family N-acetyltransferase [Paenibacillus caseinilyticus]
MPRHREVGARFLFWNRYLQLSKEELEKAAVQSWYAVHAYDNEKLIGTGRVISDGVIHACICGVMVHPSYQKQGIGAEIIRRLYKTHLTT